MESPLHFVSVFFAGIMLPNGCFALDQVMTTFVNLDKCPCLGRPGATGLFLLPISIR